jgi:hypothetical protein
LYHTATPTDVGVIFYSLSTLSKNAHTNPSPGCLNGRGGHGCGTRAGVDAIHNPHAWRHTFAKMAIMNGADLTMVQRLMGHRSIKITADYYSHYAVDELALIHDRVSPVAGLTNGNGDNGDNEGENGAEKEI